MLQIWHNFGIFSQNFAKNMSNSPTLALKYAVWQPCIIYHGEIICNMLCKIINAVQIILRCKLLPWTAQLPPSIRTELLFVQFYGIWVGLMNFSRRLSMLCVCQMFDVDFGVNCLENI